MLFRLFFAYSNNETSHLNHNLLADVDPTVSEVVASRRYNPETHQQAVSRFSRWRIPSAPHLNPSRENII